MKIIRTYHETTVFPEFNTWVGENVLTLQLRRRYATYKAFVTNVFGLSGIEEVFIDTTHTDVIFMGEGDTEYGAIKSLYESIQGKVVNFLGPSLKSYKVVGPGTRQLCIECGEPTERCEDDALWTWQVTSMGGYNYGPLCQSCYNKHEDK